MGLEGYFKKITSSGEIQEVKNVHFEVLIFDNQHMKYWIRIIFIWLGQKKTSSLYPFQSSKECLMKTSNLLLDTLLSERQNCTFFTLNTEHCTFLYHCSDNSSGAQNFLYISPFFTTFLDQGPISCFGPSLSACSNWWGPNTFPHHGDGLAGTIVSDKMLFNTVVILLVWGC